AAGSWREGRGSLCKNPLHQQKEPQPRHPQDPHHQGVEQIQPQGKACQGGGSVEQQQGPQAQQGVEEYLQGDFQGGGKDLGGNQQQYKDCPCQQQGGGHVHRPLPPAWAVTAVAEQASRSLICRSR